MTSSSGNHKRTDHIIGVKAYSVVFFFLPFFTRTFSSYTVSVIISFLILKSIFSMLLVPFLFCSLVFFSISKVVFTASNTVPLLSFFLCQFRSLLRCGLFRMMLFIVFPALLPVLFTILNGVLILNQCANFIAVIIDVICLMNFNQIFKNIVAKEICTPTVKCRIKQTAQLAIFVVNIFFNNVSQRDASFLDIVITVIQRYFCKVFSSDG